MAFGLQLSNSSIVQKNERLDELLKIEVWLKKYVTIQCFNKKSFFLDRYEKANVSSDFCFSICYVTLESRMFSSEDIAITPMKITLRLCIKKPIHLWTKKILEVISRSEYNLQVTLRGNFRSFVPGDFSNITFLS